MIDFFLIVLTVLRCYLCLPSRNLPRHRRRATWNYELALERRQEWFRCCVLGQRAESGVGMWAWESGELWWKVTLVGVIYTISFVLIVAQGALHVKLQPPPFAPRVYDRFDKLPILSLTLCVSCSLLCQVSSKNSPSPFARPLFLWCHARTVSRPILWPQSCLFLLLNLHDSIASSSWNTSMVCWVVQTMDHPLLDIWRSYLSPLWGLSSIIHMFGPQNFCEFHSTYLPCLFFPYCRCRCRVLFAHLTVSLPPSRCCRLYTVLPSGLIDAITCRRLWTYYRSRLPSFPLGVLKYKWHQWRARFLPSHGRSLLLFTSKLSSVSLFLFFSRTSLEAHGRYVSPSSPLNWLSLL